MELILNTLCVVVLLGSAATQRSGPRDGYEETELQIGESTSNNGGFGNKININSRSQLIGDSIPKRQKSPVVGKELPASQSGASGQDMSKSNKDDSVERPKYQSGQQGKVQGHARGYGRQEKHNVDSQEKQESNGRQDHDSPEKQEPLGERQDHKGQTSYRKPYFRKVIRPSNSTNARP